MYLLALIISALFSLALSIFLSPRSSLVLFFFTRQMFVIAKVGCDAWWLALVFCGAPPLLYEKVCVGDSNQSERVREACCCYVLITWRTDEPLPLATFRFFLPFFRPEATSGQLFWIAPGRTCSFVIQEAFEGMDMATQLACRS